MSEDDSRGEEEMKDKEEDTDSGDKGEEDQDKGEEEEEEEAKVEEPKLPKKRGRKPGSGAAAAAKKPKKEKAAPAPAEGAAKKKRKLVRKHPKTIDMIVEAIDNMGEKQGSSVQAIKSYIVQNFKTVRPDMVKSMLRRSLLGGLQQGVLARPKAQADTQAMSGRYLLGKSAKEDEDEVMPKQSKRAQDAMRTAKLSLKKKPGRPKKSAKKSPKKPVARKAPPPKAKTPIKTPIKRGRRGRK